MPDLGPVRRGGSPSARPPSRSAARVIRSLLSPVVLREEGPFTGPGEYFHMHRSFLYSALAVAVLALAGVPRAAANHPVLLEGNCNNPPAGDSAAGAGVCGDYDGDGLIGVDEDLDGDRVFGTLAGANGSAGAHDNGTITIVTSGTFAEAVTLSGNITLQAAPGVHAAIDAVLQGDPGSGARQGMTGVTVDAPASRHVVIRNIEITNWTTGIAVMGASRVSIEGSRIGHNTAHGIRVSGSAQVV